MNNPIHIDGNKTYTKSNNVKYTRNCDNCGKQYTGWGRFFCSKKCRTQPKGEMSPSWKGVNITRQAGRERAVKLFPLEPCEICNNPKAERHHIDGNPVNNIRTNIMFLCRKHHILIEKRYLHMLKARGIVPLP
jgi:hypothetical protein